MKSEVINTPQQFQPLTLTIRIDSAKELLALRALYGYSTSVAEAVKPFTGSGGANHLEGIGREFISDVFAKAFHPLHQAALDRKLF